MRLIAILSFIALSLTLALPAAARPMDKAEEKALAKSVGIYLRAIGRGEAERVVAALPPRVLNVFAGQAGIEASTLNKTLADQMLVMMKGSKFSDFTSETKGMDANDAVLADGTTVTWVVIPTAFTAETSAGKTRNEQPLLVLREGKQWYMMRMDPAAQQMVSFAYPFLKDVKFPPSRATPLN